MCSALFCVLSGQSITDINAGPQDTEHKGKNTAGGKSRRLVGLRGKSRAETAVVCHGLNLLRMALPCNAV